MPDIVLAGHLYRVAQEAVNNALKHATANEIRIGLERQGDSFVLEVEDDGDGLPETASHRRRHRPPRDAAPREAGRRDRSKSVPRRPAAPGLAASFRPPHEPAQDQQTRGNGRQVSASSSWTIIPWCSTATN
ncbi:MAG: ATP-binding protein [Chthoniobacter sp.]